MSNKQLILGNATEYMLYQTDVQPNVLGAFTYCETTDNVYLSPKGLLLLSELSMRTKSRNTAISRIMHACDISIESEISHYIYNILWGQTDIKKRKFSEMSEIFNPYELELLDLAYFGDFIISSQNFQYLISTYETNNDKVIAISVYEDLCDKMFSKDYKKWELLEYSSMVRIPVILELAKRFLQHNPVLNYNFILEYVEENAKYVAQDLELLYDQDD